LLGCEQGERRVVQGYAALGFRVAARVAMLVNAFM